MSYCSNFCFAVDCTKLDATEAAYVDGKEFILKESNGKWKKKGTITYGGISGYDSAFGLKILLL